MVPTPVALTPVTVTPTLPVKSYAIAGDNFSPKKLFDDLQTLLVTGKQSDVTLVIGGKRFACHKTILIARSPVFEAMFQSDFKEKNENKVEIMDLDANVGAVLLHFIYTEKAPNLDHYAPELLGAAEKVCLSLLPSSDSNI